MRHGSEPSRRRHVSEARPLARPRPEASGTAATEKVCYILSYAYICILGMLLPLPSTRMSNA